MQNTQNCLKSSLGSRCSRQRYSDRPQILAPPTGPRLQAASCASTGTDEPPGETIRIAPTTGHQAIPRTRLGHAVRMGDPWMTCNVFPAAVPSRWVGARSGIVACRHRERAG